MSTSALTGAIRGLLESATIPGYDMPPVHNAYVPGSLAMPWVVFSLGLPDVSERSMAHRPHARVARLSVKSVSATGDGCGLIGDAVDAVLEGAHLNVTGWRLGPLGLFNTMEPYPDFQVELTNGSNPVVQLQEYRFTAVRE